MPHPAKTRCAWIVAPPWPPARAIAPAPNSCTSSGRTTLARRRSPCSPPPRPRNKKFPMAWRVTLQPGVSPSPERLTHRSAGRARGRLGDYPPEGTMPRRTPFRAAAGALAAVRLAGAALAYTNAIMADGFDGPAAGPYSDEEASRFLHQATFAPTPAAIPHLRQLGYGAWIDEQCDLPMSLESPYIQWGRGIGETVYQPLRLEAWWLGAIGGPDPANTLLIHKDQLRQRMAFALSQIFVISAVD